MQTILLRLPGRMAFEVSADVVNVHAEEVSESMRLEDSSGHVCGHHGLDVALQEAA